MADILHPTIIGHPFAPIGRGEDARCTFRALRSVGIRPRVLDVYRHLAPCADQEREFGPYMVDEPGDVNLFHVNGDEVAPVLERLATRMPAGARNIVYPQWELSRYPAEWARELDRFDEIWAPSRFVFDALAPVVTRPLVHMPLACEPILTSLIGRRAFGIPEDCFAFLFFFDFRSHIERKNPWAVIDAFEACLVRADARRARLVIKLNGSELKPEAAAKLRDRLEPLGEAVIVIDRTMSDNEVKNLMRCCDCFVSLHRAEGFGRGIAEAMQMGKPVICTAYSGNMDFCDAESAQLVPYTLVDVKPGEYPHWEGQRWAEADLVAAADAMTRVICTGTSDRAVVATSSIRIRLKLGNRSIGSTMAAALVGG